MRKIFGFLLILGAIAAGAVLARNSIITFAVQKGVKASTGLDLNIGSLSVGLRETFIDIGDLHLMNPAGFPEGIMFDAPRVFVNYDLGAMLRGKVHLKDVNLDFKELHIVRNRQGQFNVQAIQLSQGKKSAGKEGGPAQEGKPAGQTPEFRIDRARIKVGKVVYVDYSGGGEPSVREFDVNIAQEMENISNSQQLLTAIAQQALMKTALGNLISVELETAVESFRSRIGSFTQQFGK